VTTSPTVAPREAGPPPDHQARERIRHQLDETLFVQAGAGSGKTRALVERIVNLVASGTAGLAAIAAITFTEKAAAELRDRVRRALGAARDRAQAAGDDTTAQRCLDALGELDSAAIGTLHSYARRLLTEHPIEAGLPPRIEVLDEVGSAVAFDDRWAGFLDQLLADPAVERPLLLAIAGGVRPDHLRQLALGLNQNWDLARDFAPASALDVAPWDADLGALLADIVAAEAETAHCCDDADLLPPLLTAWAAWARRVQGASDELAKLSLLADERGRPRGGVNGRQDNWPGYDLAGLKERCRGFGTGIDELRNRVVDQAVRLLAVELRRFTLEASAERRTAGELEFHDLLVLTREMLRDPEQGPAVRAALHDRYRHLLIDEFQDTDPIQIELAVLVAGPVDPQGGAPGPWAGVDVRPGHLFFVGDPKQSIYRFRRADISLFLQAAERFGAGAGGVSLTTNFRTGAGVIRVVNEVFSDLIREQSRDGLPSQPAYEAFTAVRGDAAVGPPVTVLGPALHTDKPTASELRRREAADVATAIRRIVGEGWLVDRTPHGADRDWQPARIGDITVLVPTRISLPSLEDALVASGISYRAESASLVYASRLVRDLLMTLRSVDDPSDELATVSALRSPLFGCGDDDLYRFRRQHRGSFDHTRALPETVPEGDPVADGLAYLAALHSERRYRSPSELADRVVRDRRVLELGEVEGRARDLWRRVRFVLDQARAWSDATNGTLRQYLAWVRQQTSEGGRVSEAVLPETDDDAVRIMTVHAAKGLEFPVTIVAGLSTQPQSRRAGAEVIFPPGRECIVRVGKIVRSEAFEAWRPVDEQMSHDERIRLLYVACTRAQDHLVVSLHRKERARPPDSDSKLTSAELLAQTLGDALADLPAIAADDRRTTDGDESTGGRGAAEQGTLPFGADPAAASLGDDDLPPFAEWQRERDAALTASGRPRTVAATALTEDGGPDAAADHGLGKRPRDLDLPPWQKGRYGSAIGRAVHGVLQTVDLATGAGVAAAVAAQAAAEAVVGHEEHVRALVDAALASATVVEAAGSPHWRELYVGAPLAGDRALEGYVDLLYRRADGLVVVDYKTGPAGPDADLDPLVARYRAQGASYALALADATGEAVVDVVFVFLTPEGAVERRLPDLARAVDEIRRRATADDGTLVET
jgi:ATP-dependent exoDNAse (exonuclease V) beta subunit